MGYKLGDRVALQSDLKNHFGTLPSGTICTIVSEPTGEENEILILRYGFNEQTKRPLIIGAGSSLLRKVTAEELSSANYKDLVARNFWVGEQYQVGRGTSFDDVEPGVIGVIKSIQLATNEFKDKLTFEFKGKNYTFDRSFVETYFDRFDPEVEKMMGEEIVIKGAERNYHLPGARMFINETIVSGDDKLEEGEIVIISHFDEPTSSYVVENMQGEKFYINKSLLTPILDAESLYTQFTTDQLVQDFYQVGRELIANEKISKHALLSNVIQPGDIVEILNFDNININALEDTFKVALNQNFDKPITLSYIDLKNFFDPIPIKNSNLTEATNDNLNQYEDTNEEFNFDVFKNDNKEQDEKILAENKTKTLEENDIEILDENKIKILESAAKLLENDKDCDCEEKEEELGLPITIHELSILDYRFKLNPQGFSIDGHDKVYSYNEIDNLIRALKELKKIGKNNNF